MTSPTFLSLPPRVQAYIFNFLKPVETFRLKQVCKAFNKALEFLWQAECNKRWPGQQKGQTISWKEHRDNLSGVPFVLTIKKLGELKPSLIIGSSGVETVAMIGSNLFYGLASYEVFRYDCQTNRSFYKVDFGCLIGNNLLKYENMNFTRGTLIDLEADKTILKIQAEFSLRPQLCTDRHVYFRRFNEQWKYYKVNIPQEKEGILDDGLLCRTVAPTIKEPVIGCDKMLYKEFSEYKLLDLNSDKTFSLICKDENMHLYAIHSQTVLGSSQGGFIYCWDFVNARISVWENGTAISALAAYKDIVVTVDANENDRKKMVKFWYMGLSRPVCGFSLTTSNGEQVMGLKVTQEVLVAWNSSEIFVLPLNKQEPSKKKCCLF